MQANWSLILNVLLLIGVLVAIGRLMRARRQSLSPDRYQPSLGQVNNSPYDSQPYNDDIIAVRKVHHETAMELENENKVIQPLINKPNLNAPQPQLIPNNELNQSLEKEFRAEERANTPSTVMMFLLAREKRQFAGYELLQTVLASGLRFGEGHLFHRHQFANGQGPVLCSLAAATATGIFDLQNIGAFSVRGLCLFMQASRNPSIDSERFNIMLETARQLSEGLDAHLLDDQRKPLTEERIVRYQRLLHIDNFAEDYVTA